MNKNLQLFNIVILSALIVSVLYGYKADAKEAKEDVVEYGIVRRSESVDLLEKISVQQEQAVKLLEEIRDILKDQKEEQEAPDTK